MSSSTNSFYVTGGTLRLDAPCYVERQADRDLFEGLLNGEFCYVLTSRQMGKSSLMVRTANKLRSQGAHVVALDLSAIGQNLTPAQWYNGLLTSMGDQLGLEDELEQFWIANERLSPLQRWFCSIRKAVLAWRRGKVVIFLDEIDSIRSLPFSTDEFFAAIRECYNRRSEDPEFNRLTFCLLGVATPSDLIRDTRITPFNIGRRIELNDFTPEEAEPLARGLRTDGAPRVSALLRRVLYWTGGHPYLTQRLCQALARDLQANRRGRVDQLCEELFFGNRARERDDNLIFVRERMLRSEADLASLLGLYLKVRNSEPVADDEANPLVSIMRLSGIARSKDGSLVERNRIYYQVFDREWVRMNLPDADLRRQRAAFRRGVVRTAVIGSLVVITMALTLTAMRQKKVATFESARAAVAQAEATLVSGYQGQRYQSLEAISKARAVSREEAKLRNLAIGALALMDLKADRKWAGYPPGTVSIAPNASLDLYARGDRQGNITIRNVANDKELVSLPGSGLPIELLLFSPSSRYLAAKYKAGTTHEFVVWDWRSRSATLRLPREINGEAWDFSPDNKRLAIGQPEGRIQVYSLESGTMSAELPLQLGTQRARVPNCIRFHPFANQLAESCESSYEVHIWNLETRQMANSFYHREPVLRLAWHPDGEWLAAGCKNGEIYLWDRNESRTPYKVLRGHDDNVVLLAFSHQGDILASYSSDRTLLLWVPFAGRQMIFHLDKDQFISLSFSTDDRHLGLSRIESEIQLWEVNPAREYRVLLGKAGTPYELESIDFSPDGRFLAAASRDDIILWDPVCGKKLGDLPGLSTQSAFFDRISGDLLASSSVLGFRRWSLRPRDNPPASRFRLESVSGGLDLPEDLGKFALSANGKVAAVIRHDEVNVFDPSSSAEDFSLKTSNYYESLALSPDGKYLAARTREGNRIDMLDLATRAPVPNLPKFDGGPYFTFSPDGEWFVTSSEKAFDFWHVGNWQLGREFKRSGSQPGPMAFSRDGKLFAMATKSFVIDLFRLPPGKAPARPESLDQSQALVRLASPDRSRLRALSFSPDGRRLAAASTGTEQLVMVWDLSLITQELSKLNLQGMLPVYPESLENPAPVELDVESVEARPE